MIYVVFLIMFVVAVVAAFQCGRQDGRATAIDECNDRIASFVERMEEAKLAERRLIACRIAWQDFQRGKANVCRGPGLEQAGALVTNALTRLGALLGDKPPDDPTLESGVRPGPARDAKRAANG